MRVLDLLEAARDSVLEIRGDGKAGGGLVLAFQSLAELLARDPGNHVQEWPFFSSARRGASIRSFMRVSRRPITAACEVTRPALALLMDEAASRTWDFAEGVPRGGTFVLNTERQPQECAERYRLSGRVLTVPGDRLGGRHLRHAIGNVSVYVAAARAIGGFDREAVHGSFLETLERRHVPRAILDRNREALAASEAEIRDGVFDDSRDRDHQPPPFAGYGELPVGAQTALRLSAGNPTAHYAPSGFRLRFADPQAACTGCAHCIHNCPEDVIRFRADAERGLRVTGVDVTHFCKLCGECIAICPEHLFARVPYTEAWEEVTAS